MDPGPGPQGDLHRPVQRTAGRLRTRHQNVRAQLRRDLRPAFGHPALRQARTDPGLEHQRPVGRRPARHRRERGRRQRPRHDPGQLEARHPAADHLPRHARGAGGRHAQRAGERPRLDRVDRRRERRPHLLRPRPHGPDQPGHVPVRRRRPRLRRQHLGGDHPGLPAGGRQRVRDRRRALAADRGHRQRPPRDLLRRPVAAAAHPGVRHRPRNRHPPLPALRLRPRRAHHLRLVPGQRAQPGHRHLDRIRRSAARPRSRRTASWAC